MHIHELTASANTRAWRENLAPNDTSANVGQLHFQNLLLNYCLTLREQTFPPLNICIELKDFFSFCLASKSTKCN